jgi:GMP synthase-like glutamine amidotransferase
MDIPWTNELVVFVKHVAEEHPLVRIIGICYGHQIVARALGGKVELSKKGWELGSYECAMTEEGRDLLGYGDDERATTMKVHQVHRDIVTVLPNQCVNLASTEKTEVQAFARRYPTDAPPLPSIAGTSAYMAFDISDFQADSSGPLPVRSAQILTLQGHPEFDEEIVETIVKARSETVSVVQLCKVGGTSRADVDPMPCHRV